MDGFFQSIRQHVRNELLGYLAEYSGGYMSEVRPGMILTPAAERDRSDFVMEYEDLGCTCFISPPCCYCTHPGNPLNQEEDDDCWMPVMKGVEA